MSYIVTLEYSSKSDHLKATADDGIHGKLNCVFPRVIYGIDRYDFRNEGVQFEVSSLNYMGKCYHVAQSAIIRVIPREETTDVDSMDTTLAKDPTTTSDISATPEMSGKDSIIDRKAKTSALPASFFEKYKENKVMNNITENLYNGIPESFFEAFENARQKTRTRNEDSPLVQRMKEMKKQETITENMESKVQGNNSLLTPFMLTEALFEAAQVPASVRLNGKEVSFADIQDPKVFNMITSPCFAGTGLPKVETWILIKLYDATIDPGERYTDINEDGVKGVKRNELLRRVGTAREAASQTSTYFNAYKALGLAYLKNRVVYPGPNLEGWLLGNTSVEVLTPPDDPSYDSHVAKYKKWPNGTDLSMFFNQPDLDKKTPCATKNTKASDLEVADDSESATTTSTVTSPLDEFPDLPGVSPETPTVFDDTDKVVSKSTIADRKAKAKALSADFFEELDPENEKDDRACVRRYDNSKIEEYSKAYREFEGLDESFEISEDTINESAFDHVCNMNGWNRDYACKLLLGRD